MNASDYAKYLVNWTMCGNVGHCDFDHCLEPATDYITSKHGEVFHFCKKHFMEVLHEANAESARQRQAVQP